VQRIIVRHPVVAAVSILLSVQGGALLAVVPLRAFVEQPSPEQTALAVMAARCLCALGLVAALGWWGRVGLTGPGRWRQLNLLWLLVPLPLLPLLDGIAPGASGKAEVYLTAALLVAVNEELLYRGLLLEVLSGFGVARAAIALAALFSAVHLPNVFAGADPAMELTRVAITAGGALGLSAIRLRTGMLWAPIVAHCGLDLAEYLAAGGIPALGQGRPFGVTTVVAVTVYSAVLGVVGLRLLRRLPATVDAAVAEHADVLTSR
jgi:membrane protease YdiL (CAAX protease family)